MTTRATIKIIGRAAAEGIAILPNTDTLLFAAVVAAFVAFAVPLAAAFVPFFAAADLAAFFFVFSFALCAALFAFTCAAWPVLL